MSDPDSTTKDRTAVEPPSETAPEAPTTTGTGTAASEPAASEAAASEAASEAASAAVAHGAAASEPVAVGPRRPEVVAFLAQHASRVLATVMLGPMLGGSLFGLLHPSQVRTFLASALHRVPSEAEWVLHQQVARWGAVGAAVTVVLAGVLLWRAYGGRAYPSRHLWLGYGLLGLPLWNAPAMELDHPFLTGVSILLFAGSVAAWASGSRRLRELAARDVSERAAVRAVGAAMALFIAWMGFLAIWRFMTFHAEPYDLSWETNATHNIVHTGIPRVSVAAGSFYPNTLLPANYADAHTPWVYYLYAPFYALWQDARTLLALQTVHMAIGALGMYWFAHAWLRRRWLGVVFAWLYLACPNIQSHCLHDVHANYLAIPTMLLALGAMERRRLGLAMACLVITSFTREETGVYAATVGAFWLLTARDRRRALAGAAGVAVALGALLLITKVVMPLSGGRPRFEHFGMFYTPSPGIGSVLGSYIFNPFGALDWIRTPSHVEYLLITSVAFGFLWVLGWRAAVFILIPAGLLFPAHPQQFYIPGMNYSAPLVPPVLLMSVLGVRRILGWGRTRAGLGQLRVTAAAYAVGAMLIATLLYGNVFAKSYKLEYGQLPYRRTNEFDYGGALGVVSRLPGYGPREKALWEIVKAVPDDGPIATSWYLNPALSNRSVAMIYPNDGSRYPKENLARYIVLDRLYPTCEATEGSEMDLRRSGKWDVLKENRWGVIFKRK